MPGRTTPIQTAVDLTSAGTKPYRYGFNGQESDFEINNKGGTSYTAEFWQYDSRLGRRWNADPIEITSESPYATFSDNPILYNDPNGDFRTKFGANVYAFFNGGTATQDKSSGEWGVVNYDVSRGSNGETEISRTEQYDWTTNRSIGLTDEDKGNLEELLDKSEHMLDPTRGGTWDPTLKADEAGKNLINLSLGVALPNVLKSGTVAVNIEKQSQLLLLESQGMRLKRIAENPKLKELVNNLWRNGAKYGDGSTGAMIKIEKAEGVITSASGSHVQKAEDALITARKLLNGVLSESDRKVVFEIIENLTNGTGLKWQK